jgi:hypothetical protein
MISSGLVATSVLNVFEKAGWSVKHRFDYNPVLINRLGFGDRRYLKSDDDPPVRLPEPTLALMRGNTGIFCEVDFRYSKGAFSAISLIRQTKNKKTYLKKFFGSRTPTRLLFGLAMPDLDLHVQRALQHLPEVDFLLVAGRKMQLYCIKQPEPDTFGTFSTIPPHESRKCAIQGTKRKPRSTASV